MARAASKKPQTIRISSKRQITIPSKLYKEKGFAEYARIEETPEGLLITPASPDEEDASLLILRQLVDEGFEGESLIERYKQARAGVLGAKKVADGACEERCASEVDREAERASVYAAVAEAAQAFSAIERAYVFGSFARNSFNDESDVDVRIEYDHDGTFTLRELAQLQKRIERTVGRSVDVVSARTLKNESLAAAIEREKVLVYEREE
ncbi:MAG: nucleotidyltransferase domain-containing protein [Eggerthellaceae bacterium]|nr:nucleotidyltransferase domain-containing protein [Eggerthellaceae bacterium]